MNEPRCVHLELVAGDIAKALEVVACLPWREPDEIAVGPAVQVDVRIGVRARIVVPNGTFTAERELALRDIDRWAGLGVFHHRALNRDGSSAHGDAGTAACHDDALHVRPGTAVHVQGRPSLLLARCARNTRAGDGGVKTDDAHVAVRAYAG